MPRGAIFDIDGTLIDSVDAHAEAWQRAFARHGYDIGFADLRSQIGKGGDQLLPTFLSGEALTRDGPKVDAAHGEIFKQALLPHLTAFPGVRPLFQHLRDRGTRIALASSAKAEELDVYTEMAAVGDLIETATSSADAEKSKPHPDIFAAALARLDLPASQVVVVGDSPYDAEAAGKIGLRTIGLLCGGFPEADLRAAGCIALFADPADLLRRFDDSPLAGA
ncbi:MAG: HAD family hydrolase [Rhodospirillales bacterium 69-11]|nr:HAD family hydrolase [Rhodospirillales bacterium]MBN8926108.1 HAD family hydrolase [Rhodospirillales bacterium]OJW26126.1 MAG: HAD family hydrolase [Rhodospirillales bacterium 69-11]